MLDYKIGGNNDIYKNEYTEEYIWIKQLYQIGWTSLKKIKKFLKKKTLFLSRNGKYWRIEETSDTFIIIGSLIYLLMNV